jgi:DNA-directed RNA polymerase specialized sigma24 family protein
VRREVGIPDDSLLDKLSPPAVGYLREVYRDDVNAAIRTAVARLDEDARALLRYSLIEGRTTARIGALYGIHRASAARRVAAVRDDVVHPLAHVRRIHLRRLPRQRVCARRFAGSVDAAIQLGELSGAAGFRRARR